MCCKYYIGDSDPDTVLANYLEEAKRRAEVMGLPITASGEVRPTDIAPVIAPCSKTREPGAFPMKWGFTHPARKLLIFNTRCETAAENPLFAGSVKERRCLIPATNYFEWKKAGKNKTKYAINLKSGPLYMAGLYFKIEGERFPCVSILTTDAAGGVEAVHSRMPVLIPEGGIDEWLSAAPYEKALAYVAAEAEYVIA